MKESDRIIKVYEERDASAKADLYSYSYKPFVYNLHRRESEILSTLYANISPGDLPHLKILDVGCGGGGTLLHFVHYGATPENCCGVDLTPHRIEKAKKLHPHIDFRCCGADALPFPDGHFDILLCYTVFSSILDAEMKTAVAAEMVRALKDDGFILWYDFRMNNPSNPDVRGIKMKELEALFPGAAISMKKSTLAPPLMRKLVPVSEYLCTMLERLTILNTHYLGVIRKK